MKKFLVSFLLALVLAASVQAGTLAAFTTYGPITWTSVDTAKTIYTAGGLDSVKGADTMFLFKAVTYEPGYIYALQTEDSVGATDSLLIHQIFYSTSRGNKVRIGGAVCDTFEPQATVGSFYRFTALTVGNPYPCVKFDVNAVGWISGKIAKIRRAELWRGKFSK
jgi:hypothetical protein